MVNRCREEEALVVGPQAPIVCAECGRSFTWIRKLNKPSNVDLQLHKTEILELIIIVNSAHEFLIGQE